MNFSSKINITVFFIIINLISVKGFPYTFYVETSEFNDNVYIIQNVVGDVSGNQVSQAFISETEIKTNNSQSKNQNNDIERYNNNLRDYSKVCTNLKLKPKSNIRKEFEENSYRKGISETSLKKAKDYWDSNEVSYGVDPCIKKLDTNHLFSTVNSLNRLLLKENINLAHLYPKIYFFNTENIKNIESFSSVSKDKYLKELLVETSNLRQELLSSKGSEIIYNNYYHYLLDKSFDQQLNEKTRQIILLRIHDEIPYSIEVSSDNIINVSKSKLRIFQSIYVHNQRHRSILIGKKGETIKSISISGKSFQSIQFICAPKSKIKGRLCIAKKHCDFIYHACAIVGIFLVFICGIYVSYMCHYWHIYLFLPPSFLTLIVRLT